MKDTLAETLAAFQDRSVMSTDSPGSMVIKLLDQLVTGEEVRSSRGEIWGGAGCGFGLG